VKRIHRVPPYLWGLLIGVVFATVYFKVRNSFLDGRHPELSKLDDQKTRAGKPWLVQVELASDAEWDKRDESKIALYEVAKNDLTTVKEVGGKEISSGKISMPALENGKRYRMLTSFYFCNKTNKTQCRIQGEAMDLYPDNQSEPLTVKLDVGPKK
jgi:hypothetical protein